MIAEDIAKGVMLDTAIDRALDITEKEVFADVYTWGDIPEWERDFLISKMEAPFPGWQHDLGLIGRYKQEISQGFSKAEDAGAAIRVQVAMGKLMVPNRVMYDLISEKVREILTEVMTPLWKSAWNLGYDSANQLLGKDSGVLGTTDNLQGFLDTEGAHWLDQIARTGLKNANSRSEIIARTEIARAMNAGVIQCYRDNGVTHKHLGIAPDDPCKICRKVASEGVIPLDSPFSSGGLGGPCHVQCRCVPLPAGMNIVPPQSHLGKRFITVDEARSAARGDWATSPHQYARSIFSGAGNCECGDAESNHPAGSQQEDRSRTAWLLIRARDEKGKWRYLLQQRPDGTWGMPGGTTHIGEPGYSAAYREATEEIGELPSLTVVHDFTHQDLDGQIAYLYLCETNIFKPSLNGDTPEETLSVGWFRRGEIEDLDLVGKFRDDWVKEIHLREQLGEMKTPQNLVNENGEWMVLDDPDRYGAGGGARWPYPHHANGEEYGDAGPGGYPGATPGGNPPHFEANMMDALPQTRVYPRGHEDEFPEERGAPPARRRKTPRGGFPLRDPERIEETSLQDLSANTGVPPSGEKIAPHPIVGAMPAPEAMKPHAGRPVPSEAFDPDETVEHLTPQGNVAYDLPGAEKGASDIGDPNPVEWRHVYAQLEANFPDKAIEWVKRARWIGPVNVPWDRIDTDDEDKWAASHQPEAVNRFAQGIRSGKGNTAPSILVQEPNSNRAMIVDGHHRAKARHYKLGQPVLAYVGNIDPKDREAAEQTHSSQVHQGSDPKNR